MFELNAVEAFATAGVHRQRQLVLLIGLTSPALRSLQNSCRDVFSRPAKEKVSVCPTKGQQGDFGPLIALPSVRLEEAKRGSLNVDDEGRAAAMKVEHVRAPIRCEAESTNGDITNRKRRRVFF